MATRSLFLFQLQDHRARVVEALREGIWSVEGGRGLLGMWHEVSTSWPPLRRIMTVISAAFARDTSLAPEFRT